MSTYCDYAPDDPMHASYHDGSPTTSEPASMEPRAMEIFQAGLSWRLILRKRATTYSPAARSPVNS